MTELMTEKEKYVISAQEQFYALFDAKFEYAGKAKGYKNQMLGYSSLMTDVNKRPGMEKQQQIEGEYKEAVQTLANLQRQYTATGSEALQTDITEAQKRVGQAEKAYNELQANLSDQQKLWDKIDELKKEQEKRYKDAQSRLWDFNFDHASKSKQQAMARKGFFAANNQFGGARTDEARKQALQDMQSMYSKLNKETAKMPAWNGFLNTTSGAVESNSVAAQELQERIMNDFNKAMLENVKQQTVAQKAMEAALKQIIKNTDPNQQSIVGGYAS
jgi:chromosome segregation ATPase